MSTDTTALAQPLLELTEAELDHQAFIRAARQYWTGPIFRAVAAAADGLDADELAAVLPGTAAHAGFGWLETRLQRSKYEGPHGLLAVAERMRPELDAALDAASAAAPERLVLDPDLPLPSYYTDIDIHLMPGGIYSRSTDGFVYEHAAGSTSAIGGEQRDLQAVLADEVAAIVAGLDHPATVLNLGCGFGKLERFLHEVLPPETEVIGCDLSAAVLRLAHLRALGRGQRATWVQCSAEDVSACGDETVDVVTSVQLLHEMPSASRKQAFAEAFRVLRPGGELRMIDFHPVDAMPIERFAYAGHTVRNGEPHLDDVLAAPLADDLAAVGFVDAAVESTAGPDRSHDRWRLPWAMISATKPQGSTQG